MLRQRNGRPQAAVPLRQMKNEQQLSRRTQVEPRHASRDIQACLALYGYRL
jgi:hypothetical protein